MSSFDPSPETNKLPRPSTAGTDEPAEAPARVGTVVWGLVVLALAA